MRLAQPGWDAAGFATAWAPASAVAPPSANVTVDSHAVLPPIRVGETYAPCDMWQSSPGVYVFDFCQNMADGALENFMWAHINKFKAQHAGCRLQAIEQS